MVLLDIIVVNIILFKMIEYFNIIMDYIFWVVNVYNLVFVVILIIVLRFLD